MSGARISVLQLRRMGISMSSNGLGQSAVNGTHGYLIVQLRMVICMSFSGRQKMVVPGAKKSY